MSLHLAFNDILVTDKIWRVLGEDKTRRFPKYNDVGGYPIYYIVGEQTDSEGRYKDEVIVSADTLNQNIIGGDDVVIDADINYEDDDLYDGISGERIESAYGESDDDESDDDESEDDE